MSSKSENTNVPAWWKDDLILDPYCKFTMEAVSFKAGKVNSKRHWNQVIAMMRQLLGVVITKSQCKTQFDVDKVQQYWETAKLKTIDMEKYRRDINAKYPQTAAVLRTPISLESKPEEEEDANLNVIPFIKTAKPSSLSSAPSATSASHQGPTSEQMALLITTLNRIGSSLEKAVALLAKGDEDGKRAKVKEAAARLTAQRAKDIFSEENEEKKGDKKAKNEGKNKSKAKEKSDEKNDDPEESSSDDEEKRETRASKKQKTRQG